MPSYTLSPHHTISQCLCASKKWENSSQLLACFPSNAFIFWKLPCQCLYVALLSTLAPALVFEEKLILVCQNFKLAQVGTHNGNAIWYECYWRLFYMLIGIWTSVEKTQWEIAMASYPWECFQQPETKSLTKNDSNNITSQKKVSRRRWRQG